MKITTQTDTRVITTRVQEQVVVLQMSQREALLLAGVLAGLSAQDCLEKVQGSLKKVTSTDEMFKKLLEPASLEEVTEFHVELRDRLFGEVLEV